MMKNLMRRLERLERLERMGPSAWQTKLRLCARKLQVDEEELLGIVKGHELQPDRAVADDGLHHLGGVPCCSKHALNQMAWDHPRDHP
jgi:hypothetical protein